MNFQLSQWTEVLNAVAGKEELYDTKPLKQAYITNSKFDPNAFFFLTYRQNFSNQNNRSHAIGLCLAWPIAEKEFEIKYLCSVPSHRNKGVEEALLSLVLGYCRSKQAIKVVVKFDELPIQPYQLDVLPQVLQTFGFSIQN